MKRSATLIILLSLLAGCASIPFKEEPLVSLESTDPREVVERFKSSIPDSFQLLNSIVFEYNWLTIAGIGYVDINGNDEVYKVACMNHMGVKLFEFAGNRDGLTSQYAIEPLARQGNISTVVGEDIKRIYFDRVPSPDAKITRRKHKLIFRQRSGPGALEYLFAGAGRNLVKKTYIEEDRPVWRVSYYEYQLKNGKLYPLGIIFTNYRYGYRLIVRQKEIRS